MRRRSVLAAVAALAAGSGCARVLGEDPIEVRVLRASGERADGGDERCVLSVAFVESHPVLERLLSSAETAPAGEWVTSGVDRETGERLAADLREHCQANADDAVYRYDGEEYRIRVEANDGDALLGASPSSEAIRGARAQDSP
jgi:hypothetical protein